MKPGDAANVNSISRALDLIIESDANRADVSEWAMSRLDVDDVSPEEVDLLHTLIACDAMTAPGAWLYQAEDLKDWRVRLDAMIAARAGDRPEHRTGPPQRLDDGSP